jgi:two-component system phosphate regulon sensor histidine kinase PhoR
VLMSVTLVGLIVIQFLWINNAIRLKDEEFNRNVNTAMLGVSNSLEGMCGVTFLNWKLRNDSAAREQLMQSEPGF